LRAALNRVQPDAVVHLAARTDLAETLSVHGYAPNVDGVRNLIEAIRATRSVKRAIFTSSQLVCRVGYVPASETDYAPDTPYGESKVISERIVRDEDGGGAAWCLVRPTTVWGPGMSAHYQRFIRMVEAGRYFHVGKEPLFKSYGYIGNVVRQYEKLLVVPRDWIHRKTLYLADEKPMSLPAWADAIQSALGAPPIRTLPVALARFLAAGGDIVNRLGWRSYPFNSFRLKNILTQYQLDLTETVRICGPSVITMEEGVADLVAWYKSRVAPK
jgi:nucleoside-diphosphate-sugar epimerase